MPKRNGILTKPGLNLRRAREAGELTQEDLAEKAGIERELRNPCIKNVAKVRRLIMEPSV